VKADLTRNSYDPAKNFSRVLMQQGRVQLDADWNEQGAILLHLLRRLAADIGGQAWSPDGGFLPQTLTTVTPITNDVLIPEGSFYVDGILCEIEATPVAILSWDIANRNITVARWTVDNVSFESGQYLQLTDDSGLISTVVLCQITLADHTNMRLTVDSPINALATATDGRARRLVTYLQQPNLRTPPPLSTTAPSQLYLDVWERLITSIEDDSIREVALNGVDTTARAQVIWQVMATNAQSCMTPAQLAQQFQPWNRGLLRARTEPATVSTDPCTVAPDSGYRGPENQLYRVEINTGSGPNLQPSFKWSRENGAVVFPVAAAAIPGTGTTTVPLANLGRDDRFGLAEGDWVELQDDKTLLANTAGTLLQVQSINRGSLQVVLSGSAATNFGNDPTLHPLLRRWDHKAGDPASGGLALGPDGAVPIPAPPVPPATAAWIDLENGVQVQFEEVTKTTTFRTGDFWFIPARVATGNVIWPTETAADGTITPVAKPSDGVEHHYAPLAIVTPGSGVPVITLCPEKNGQKSKGKK